MDELIKQYAGQIGRRLIAIGRAKGLKISKLDTEGIGREAINHFILANEPPSEMQPFKVPKGKKKT